MGLFEDIGEAIGNACSAIAEFFGDVFEGFITTLSNSFMEGAAGMMGIQKEPSSVYKYSVDEDGVKIKQFIDDAITGSFYKSRDQMNLEFGEVDLPELNAAVQQLAGDAMDDISVQTILHMVMTMGTLGQVNVLDEIWAASDIPHGMYDFMKTKKNLEQQIRFWIPYTRYLNQQNPNAIPGASDNVLFALREVWDKDRRTELLAETPDIKYYHRLEENGYAREIANDYWASHWVLPSVGQLNEMLHRGVITDVEWDRFVKYNDFDPTVRPWLKKISYSPYTRVDIRRMWDLRLVSRQEVKDNYLDLGYDEEHAEKMTVWTLAYVLAVEMRARYSKGWVSEADIRTALLGTGMPAARVEEYLQKIIKEDASERLDKERDLTKTDITRSVKKGLLTKAEGVERLMDLGYDEDEASFIVDITVSEGISAEIEADRDLSKADIIKGIADAVFTEAQGLEMLMKLGYSKEEAQYIIDIRVPPKKPDKLKPERDLTKTEIVKGVKKEILTWDQGIQMLYEMGYDMDEAEFILAINIEALTGSPETWSEMQNIVNKGRKAQGLPVKEISSGIKDIEGNIKKYTQERKEAEEAKKPREKIISIDNKILPLKRQHKQLVEQYQKGVK